MKKVLALSLVGMMALSLSACSDSKDQARIHELEVENAALKAQLATLQPAAAAGETAEAGGTSSPQAFADVDSEVPGYEKINDLAKLNVFKDVEGNTFKPYEPITRGQYITWLYHAYNAEHPADKKIQMSPAHKPGFTDLKPTDPSYKYVQAFSNAGFSVGYEDKTFKPNKPITREEMIAIKYGVDGGEQYSNLSTPFSDDAQIDKRYHPAVYGEGIFKSNESGNNIQRAFGAIKTFKPKEPVLRNEAAASMWATDHRANYTAAKAIEEANSSN